MNIKKAIALTGLVAAIAGVSPLAFAQDSGWYAGLGVGQSKVELDCTGTTSCDDKDTAWNIFGGYQFNKHFGAELGYTNLGKPSLGDAISTTTIETKGFEVLGVGTYPINQQFSVYGKLGFFLWHLDANDNVFGSISESGTDFTHAIGASFNFTKTIAGTLQWQRYYNIGNSNTIGESDIDVIGVGVIFKF